MSYTRSVTNRYPDHLVWKGSGTGGSQLSSNPSAARKGFLCTAQQMRKPRRPRAPRPTDSIGAAGVETRGRRRRLGRRHRGGRRRRRHHRGAAGASDATAGRAGARLSRPAAAARSRRRTRKRVVGTAASQGGQQARKPQVSTGVRPSARRRRRRTPLALRRRRGRGRRLGRDDCRGVAALSRGSRSASFFAMSAASRRRLTRWPRRRRVDSSSRFSHFFEALRHATPVAISRRDDFEVTTMRKIGLPDCREQRSGVYRPACQANMQASASVLQAAKARIDARRTAFRALETTFACNPNKNARVCARKRDGRWLPRTP